MKITFKRCEHDVVMAGELEIYYESNPPNSEHFKVEFLGGKWILRHAYLQRVECSQEQSWELFEARKNGDFLVLVDVPYEWIYR